MKNNKTYHPNTREALLKHYQTYPKLQTEDIFKYIFQSALGCEHLLASKEKALDYIKREYASSPQTDIPLIERLDGAYSRVYLSVLKTGLSPETLATLFCLSAKKEPHGKQALEAKLAVASALVHDGELPLDRDTFDQMCDAWRSEDYPAVHHSEAFRAAYHPAYRVIDNRYADILPIFSEIDGCFGKGVSPVAIAVTDAKERASLAEMLREIYACDVVDAAEFLKKTADGVSVRPALLVGDDLSCLALEKGAYCVIRLEN